MGVIWLILEGDRGKYIPSQPSLQREGVCFLFKEGVLNFFWEGFGKNGPIPAFPRGRGDILYKRPKLRW